MLLIRRLNSDDLPLRPFSDECLAGEEVLLRIGRSGFTLDYLPSREAVWRSFPPDPRALPQQALASPNIAAFLALSDGVPVGYAAVSPADHGWLELLDLRVDAAFRRRGIARALTDTCMDHARQHGLYGLKAVVSDQHPVLCQFCEHTGFALLGVDRGVFSQLPQESVKPLAARTCALLFYKHTQKG